jgi:3-keto-5-aminohexanoate cleavage enzyme
VARRDASSRPGCCLKNAMPPEEHLLDSLLGETRRILPKATWTAAGIGVNQRLVMEWALERRADAVRTGLENNVRLHRDCLAASNAELVQVAVKLRAEQGAQPATFAEARTALGLTYP